MNDQDLNAGIDFLATAGLNLFAVLDCNALPEVTAGAIDAAGVPVAEYRRLVLVGHGGRRLWTALGEWGMRTADPVDHYSMEMTRQFIHDYLDETNVLWLYPGSTYLVPLQQLGQAAGWSQPSPLGQGIHPKYGVWFAYRAAFLTMVELPLHVERPGPSPCESCAEKPCIATCPVSAVKMGSFDVEGCGRFRISQDSACADRCLARMACPFFPEHRYDLEQIRYHYLHSLPTLRKWYGG